MGKRVVGVNIKEDDFVDDIIAKIFKMFPIELRGVPPVMTEFTTEEGIPLRADEFIPRCLLFNVDGSRKMTQFQLHFPDIGERLPESKSNNYAALESILSKGLFNMMKILHDLQQQQQVTIESISISPSIDCQSNPDSLAKFNKLLECLNLVDTASKLSTRAIPSTCFTSFEHFAFQWSEAERDISEHVKNTHRKLSKKSFFGFIFPPNSSRKREWMGEREMDKENEEEKKKEQEKEKGSLEEMTYVPFLEYLTRLGFHAQVVDRHGLLYSTEVYSLKPNIKVSSDDLRKTGDQAKVKFLIKGRTDVVILNARNSTPNRVNTVIAIEVKPVGFNEEISLREAFLQLIGLNIANPVRYPPVILTNLTDIHYVLKLQIVDAEKLQDLLIKKFSLFNQALQFSYSLKDEGSIAKHFGAVPIPERSMTSVAEDKEDEGNCEFVEIQ